ncbi:MAG: hypothetical protein OXU75_19580 [Deltaproteobacteria bacterium]|nr:hypothetical protein [Deltaproteobacteria bacterium]
MFYRFEFEAEFYPTLERVPFHVRMKLDLVGVRVSLSTWRAFSLEERRALCHLPAETDEEKEVFAAFLAALAETRAGVEAERCPALDPDAWAAASVPDPVAARSEGEGMPVTPAEWGRWAAHERYALYKTALSKDPELFRLALRELRARLCS